MRRDKLFSSRMMGGVYFLPAEIECPIKNEASVLELALKHKIAIDNSCGGSGSCGTCRVFLNWRAGKSRPNPAEVFPPRSDVEAAMAEDRQFSVNERLSCQIEPDPEMIITVPEPGTFREE